MKPLLERLPLKKDESFFTEAFDLPYFGTPWHYHAEYEIVLIRASSGKKIVGNRLSEFREGDISFFGPNLPHVYHNPDSYYDTASTLRARSVVIHFLENSLGNDFLSLPQSRSIQNLLIRSRKGIHLHGQTRLFVQEKMLEMLNQKGFSRLLSLLQILHHLAESTEISYNSDEEIVGHNLFDSDRMAKVLNLVLLNFNREISLDEVASLIYMTPTSFCRFFKNRTKKSFSSYLTDVRLNHAAKRLQESMDSVRMISYQSGFNNLSNFNRQFKKKFFITPKEYRKLHIN